MVGQESAAMGGETLCVGGGGDDEPTGVVRGCGGETMEKT